MRKRLITQREHTQLQDDCLACFTAMTKFFQGVNGVVPVALLDKMSHLERRWRSVTERALTEANHRITNEPAN